MLLLEDELIKERLIEDMCFPAIRKKLEWDYISDLSLSQETCRHEIKPSNTQTPCLSKVVNIHNGRCL